MKFFRHKIQADPGVETKAHKDTAVEIEKSDEDIAKAEALLTVMGDGEDENKSADMITKKTDDKNTEKEGTGDNDLLSSLFKQEEIVEKTSTAILTALLPDTSAQELLNDAHQIQALMYQWQQSQKQKAQMKVKAKQNS